MSEATHYSMLHADGRVDRVTLPDDNDQSQGHFQQALGTDFMEVVHLCHHVAAYVKESPEATDALNVPIALAFNKCVRGPAVLIDPRPDEDGNTRPLQAGCENWIMLAGILVSLKPHHDHLATRDDEPFQVVGIFMFDPETDTLEGYNG